MKIQILSTLALSYYTKAFEIVSSKSLDIVDTKNKANQLLSSRRVRRSNSDIFEELSAASFERECIEERCSKEEMLEALEDVNMRDKKWAEFTRKY